MVSKLFQHALPQRDPFSTLETYTHLSRAADRRGSVVGELGKRRLVIIFPKVMDILYGHKGSDSQTIINMVYRVRPIPPPNYRLIDLRPNPLIRRSMPSPAPRLSESNAWNPCARFASRTTCFRDHSRSICPLVRRASHTIVVDLRTY